MTEKVLDNKFESGEKVRIITDKENKIYDFGYYSQNEGRAVIYEEGEINMQDSIIAKLKELRRIE
ncbi:MAG: hypothetical protein M1416_02010 [Candidatus Pacearchaeota archaeon]|nr:hypothetical protein [Candidatus Pacearchaeota archaeon]